MVGCQQAETPSQERWKQQILVLNTFTEPPSLDPSQGGDSVSSTILQVLFEPLARRDADGILKPAAAETIDVSADGKTYTFHLRHALWSNGEPVTAKDFAFAWKHRLGPSVPGIGLEELYYIRGAREAKLGTKDINDVGIHVIDDHTLVVELENPIPYFLDIVSYSCYLPINRTVSVRNPKWMMEAGPDYVCNGPFMLVSWQHHNELVLVKNPLYWDSSAVKLNKIVMMMVEDSTTDLALFEKEVIDWTGKPFMNILPESIPSLIASGKLNLYPLSATYIYHFNVDRVPFTNVNIRRALSYAINRQGIVDNLTQGGEKPATALTAPPLSLRPEGYFPIYDPVQARRYLEQGLQELDLTKQQLPSMALTYNRADLHHTIAQAIQQDWKDILGLDVQLQSLEWKVHLDAARECHFDIARFTRPALYSDPMTFLERYKDKNSHSNCTNWSDPRYALLLLEAEGTSDQTKRLALLEEAEAILMDQMPIIPIYFHTGAFMRTPHLKGVYLSPFGHIDFKTAFFDVAP